MWQTRVSYVDGAYITLVNTELGFRLFKLGILNFWFRISNTRIAPLVGFCGALPCFDSIRRCAPLIRFCGAIMSYDGELRSHGRLEEQLCCAVQRWWRGSDCDPDHGVVLWLLLCKVSNFWLSFRVVLFFITFREHIQICLWCRGSQNRMRGAHLRMESKQEAHHRIQPGEQSSYQKP